MEINIKEIRLQKGLSQQQMADLIDVPKDRLAKWEQRNVVPKVEDYEKIKKLDMDNFTQIESKSSESSNSLLPIPEGVPVYDTEFSLGFNEKIKESPSILGYINLAAFKGCDAIVRAKGESMARYINNNDWIGIKRIYDFDVINYGNPYGIVTKELEMIKYLKKGKSPDTYLLKCENEKFEDFEIKKSKVLELYLIKTVMPILTII
jgi:transcriptional regulator with XRE-family HTH domain